MNAAESLPLDLERWIFESAAFHHPECRPSLIRVAQRVRLWIEPMLYRVLPIHPTGPRTSLRRHPLPAIYHAMDTGRKASFRKYARHVCFMERIRRDDIIKILSLCNATTNLALMDVVGHPSLLPVISSLRLERFSGVLRQLFPIHGAASIDFMHPIFTHITHLDVLDWGQERWAVWAGLAQMPRLTHLSFRDDLIPNYICRGALTHCPILEVLVILCTQKFRLDRQVLAREPLAADPRFVMIAVSDYVDDWETGACGGRTYWVVADALVKKRVSGQTTEYFMSSVEYERC
ncbi:hypothetical protein C8R43DRAFT_1076307 [Mycena crocata]|nr:hypothetical protein C8R43DRAFT_1076307 [Mycena crocata]